MARGDYYPGPPQKGTDSIAVVSGSFDDMSRQINQRTSELEASRLMYKSLFEDAPCYLTVVSRDYRLVRANRAFSAQFGEQLGKHCYEGYKGLDFKCSNCPVEKTFQDGTSHQSEETWSIDGEEIHVIVKTRPLFDDTGTVAEVMEMSVDVTSLKRLQLELEHRQREYQNLFENVPCYLTVVDRDFNIIQTNTVFERVFGRVGGRKCYKIYKSNESKCSNCPVEKTFEDGKSHNSEEIWRHDGKETHIMVKTAPLMDEKGRLRAVMEMSTDVTEMRMLQSELAMLGETIAGMSHSIKNILAGLQGGIYVIDSGLKSSREDKVKAGWDMVKKNVEKISRLVKGILYASKERQPEYRGNRSGNVAE